MRRELARSGGSARGAARAVVLWAVTKGGGGREGGGPCGGDFVGGVGGDCPGRACGDAGAAGGEGEGRPDSDTGLAAAPGRASTRGPVAARDGGGRRGQGGLQGGRGRGGGSDSDGEGSWSRRTRGGHQRGHPAPFLSVVADALPRSSPSPAVSLLHRDVLQVITADAMAAVPPPGSVAALSVARGGGGAGAAWAASSLPLAWRSGVASAFSWRAEAGGGDAGCACVGSSEVVALLEAACFPVAALCVALATLSAALATLSAAVVARVAAGVAGAAIAAAAVALSPPRTLVAAAARAVGRLGAAAASARGLAEALSGRASAAAVDRPDWRSVAAATAEAVAALGRRQGKGGGGGAAPPVGRPSCGRRGRTRWARGGSPATVAARAGAAGLVSSAHPALSAAAVAPPPAPRRLPPSVARVGRGGRRGSP